MEVRDGTALITPGNDLDPTTCGPEYYLHAIPPTSQYKLPKFKAPQFQTPPSREEPVTQEFTE